MDRRGNQALLQSLTDPQRLGRKVAMVILHEILPATISGLKLELKRVYGLKTGSGVTFAACWILHDAQVFYEPKSKYVAFTSRVGLCHAYFRYQT